MPTFSKRYFLKGTLATGGVSCDAWASASHRCPTLEQCLTSGICALNAMNNTRIKYGQGFRMDTRQES